jgi:hypothetical protein
LEEKFTHTKETALMIENQFSMVLAIYFDICAHFSHSDFEPFHWRLDILFLTALEDQSLIISYYLFLLKGQVVAAVLLNNLSDLFSCFSPTA